jgi:plasmid stability protein
MSQLLVRDIEPAVVARLRRSAAAQGVSMEEAHRRLLRAALLGDQPEPQADFLAYLRAIPPGENIDFPRASDLPRTVEL